MKDCKELQALEGRWVWDTIWRCEMHNEIHGMV
jgi:hypothetical protein